MRGPSLRWIGTGLASVALASILVVIALAGQGRPAGYGAAVLADGPVAFWRLDERTGVVAREARNRGPGRYRGGPALGRGGALTGQAGTAVAFDGVNDDIRIARLPPFSARRGLTVELWVRALRGGTRQVVLARRGPGGAGGYTIWLDRANHVRATFAAPAASVTLTSIRPVDTRWHHVVATYGGATARLYVDGRLQAQRRRAGALGPSTAPLRLAARTGDRARFRGALDEVAIYHRVLGRARVEAHFRAAGPRPAPGTTPPPGAVGATGSPDTTAPTVTLTQPADGATLATATPTFAGIAGTAAGDDPAVTVRVSSGSTAGGAVVQTLIANRQAGGAYVVSAATLPNGTYTTVTQQSDAAGNTGVSNAVTFTIAVGPSNDPVLVGAGDIAGCGSTPRDAETAALLSAPGNANATVFTLGDNAYDNGSREQFEVCYGDTWGAELARTRPIIGDHDLETDGATNYVDYFRSQLEQFGESAADPTRLYYTYTLGTWRVVALNSVCILTPGCNPAAQEAWFDQTLTDNPSQCTLVMMHTPRFSSGNIHGPSSSMQGFWQIAYDHRVELIVSGDEHVYERFHPLDNGGQREDGRGVRQFIAGTGGYLLYGFASSPAESAHQFAGEFGVLRFTLRQGSYDWVFMPINGGAPVDPGSALCH